jgi:CRP/FNR family cyclic AMP-dependent transcriptional regulator
MLKPLEVATLASLPIFEGVPEDDLAALRPLLHRKVFAPDTTIINAEQPGEVAYLVLEGGLKIVGEDGGKDVILAVRGAGEIVGEMSLLDGMGRSATVITLEESTLLWVDRADFWDRLWKLPAVPINMARILSKRLRLCTAQVQALAALDVNGRIARQLLAFGREYGQASPNGSTLIPIRLTQTELADMVGASRVSVNQVLVYWKRRKYISVDERHRITILNQAALEGRCQ